MATWRLQQQKGTTVADRSSKSKSCKEAAELSDGLLKGRIADALEGGEWPGGNSEFDESIRGEYGEVKCPIIHGIHLHE